jgi:hypothetical protein
MSFPDLKSLTNRAKQRGFRQPNEGESEADYRAAFADYMVNIDRVESMEIRTSRGWDEWTDADKHDALFTHTPKALTVEHYKYMMVPAGEWKRENWQEAAVKDGTAPVTVGSTDEARPHIVPISEDAKKVALLDGMMGSFGFPTGYVKQGDEWVLSYRFMKLDQEHAETEIIPEMVAEVERMMHAARADARPGYIDFGNGVHATLHGEPLESATDEVS